MALFLTLFVIISSGIGFGFASLYFRPFRACWGWSLLVLLLAASGSILYWFWPHAVFMQLFFCDLATGFWGGWRMARLTKKRRPGGR